jgi:glycerophosphoryl diester phosphodiesterase
MLMIAHRGASGHAPENTMAAFKLALEMGAKAIEFDVHQTRDGELVVLHDDDLKRVARRKARIRSLTLAELHQSEVGSWFAKDFASEKVPTLAQLFELAHGRAELHLEIKHGSKVYPGIERNIVEFLRRHHALGTTLISSFDHSALFNVRDIEPEARLGYLLGLTLMPKAWREMKEMKADSLNCSGRQVNARRVAAAHQLGLKVFVYTVNAQKDVDRLGKMGVDGVFTNYPELTSP